ncbi:MAG: hypothetical protein P8179_24010, partial [Candidatus Thiodiazotropha sp.]
GFADDPPQFRLVRLVIPVEVVLILGHPLQGGALAVVAGLSAKAAITRAWAYFPAASPMVLLICPSRPYST